MKKYNYISSAKRTLKIESDSIKSVSNQFVFSPTNFQNPHFSHQHVSDHSEIDMNAQSDLDPNALEFKPESGVVVDKSVDPGVR